MGISRASVTQMLNLLRLPEKLKEEIKGMGDYWGRRLLIERNAGMLIAGCYLDASI